MDQRDLKALVVNGVLEEKEERGDILVQKEKKEKKEIEGNKGLLVCAVTTDAMKIAQTKE